MTVDGPDGADRLVTRSGVRIDANPSRVLARLFVPGHELVGDEQSRATGVLARILALPEDVVAATLDRVLARFDGRHRDLSSTLLENYERIAHRVPDGASVSPERRLAIGACFTHEFTTEGAALFNPSAVPHPDQSGLAPGQLRFVLSVRAVGEGHLSCVEFRTGVLGPGRAIQIEDPGPYLDAGKIRATTYERSLFADRLAEDGADGESARFLISKLAPRFDEEDLERALTALRGQRVTRHDAVWTDQLARHLGRCSYEVVFPPESSIGERVLWPRSPSESRGIEDARFVRFVEDDGAVHYRATYTAFDGERVAPQVIDTDDFRQFRLSPLAGSAAKDKGMALFPRKLGGRHVALSRWDRETSALATSDDGLRWDDPVALDTPGHPWELIQVGNCGSPVETEAGWLVLTHGVGPMREYGMGALLLDLDDPQRVIGKLSEPLMVPEGDERDGYVPNVVYSCGSLRYGDDLFVPYGASDTSVRFAFVDLPGLLERLGARAPSAATRAKSSA